ncbi:Serine carboxypeptidase-like 33 [Zostera marina]|uniref:Carboxypeptidase n=1 Tax=Zostera marina TaxID=29655 RepID=A0A0K9PJG6_ZOSMR|nr:Serine carboxypeptidase-like 33 [Zostera marina]
MMKLFFPMFMLFSFLLVAEANDSTQESDRILNLPGQPNTTTMASLSQFSGYITVNKHNGRALFYWFFEAQTQSSTKPLLLWLNGGPGCSSIGYGAAVELGPLKVKKKGRGLELNKFAWNNEANLLFVESPVGVGFSYTNTTSDLYKLDDDFVAEDTYNFIINWLKRFPQFQRNDLFLAGESYAGHYVPQLAELLYDRNKDYPKNHYQHTNLKGFIVGNPETEDYYDTKGLVEYAWSHAVISDQLYNLLANACDFTLAQWTKECSELMNQVFQKYREIDIYNIYAPKCLLPKPASSSSKIDNNKARRMRIPAGYDPCFESYTEAYFNRDDVKRSMHADLAGKWKVCSDSILNTYYNYTVASVLPIYTKLIKAGLRIWIYSGDADGRVPVIGSRYCVEALGLHLKTKWKPWYHQHQVAGRFVEYEGLTMATVRGAGHLVPLNKPREALRLINTYLSNQKLPTDRSSS